MKVWDSLKFKKNNIIEPIARLDCINGYVRACKVTPDSRSLIVAGESREIVICDISKPQPEITNRLLSPSFIYALSTSMDSRYLYSCTIDGLIHVWDMHNAKLIKYIIYLNIYIYYPFDIML